MSIDWGWEDDWGSTGRSSQGFDLSFYPTAAVRIDGGLILAGIRATDGNTVIERWSVTYPAPGAAGSSYAATVTAVETLLDASVPGRKGVRLMCVLQRAELAPTSVLVQFNDSNALHVLDITDGTLELLWDTTAVPALANPDWLFIWSADHPSHGHLYLWQPFQGQEEFSTLVGFDADRDGTLDVWGLLDEASFEALLGSPATWTKTFE